MVQLKRDDDEALQLLLDATQSLQSGEVWCQLAALQRELKDYQSAWDSLAKAETFWPLAKADSHYFKWLAGERCDVAYFLGRYDEAIELAEKTERPYFQRMAERLRTAVAKRSAMVTLPNQSRACSCQSRSCASFTILACLPRFRRWLSIGKRRSNMRRSQNVFVTKAPKPTTNGDGQKRNGFAPREFRITETTVEQLIRQGVPMTLTTVEPGSAHSQGIVGIDVYRGTLLVQDPNERHVGEAASDKFLEHYASTGPRGMLMVPKEEVVARIAALN